MDLLRAVLLGSLVVVSLVVDFDVAPAGFQRNNQHGRRKDRLRVHYVASVLEGLGAEFLTVRVKGTLDEKSVDEEACVVGASVVIVAVALLVALAAFEKHSRQRGRKKHLLGFVSAGTISQGARVGCLSVRLVCTLEKAKPWKELCC